MIIWSGWGAMVVVFAFMGMVFGGYIVGELGVEAGWPFGLGLLLAAALNYVVAKKLDARGQVVIDPETGEQVLLKTNHSLFFIPMRFWTYVLVSMGVLGLVGDVLALLDA